MQPFNLFWALMDQFDQHHHAALKTNFHPHYPTNSCDNCQHHPSFSQTSNKTFVTEESSLVLETLEEGRHHHYLIPIQVNIVCWWFQNLWILNFESKYLIDLCLHTCLLFHCCHLVFFVHFNIMFFWVIFCLSIVESYFTFYLLHFCRLPVAGGSRKKGQNSTFSWITSSLRGTLNCEIIFCETWF